MDLKAGDEVPELTAGRVRELLGYDRLTGVFTWLVGLRGHAAGAVAGHLTRFGYWSIMIDGRNYPAHCLAWLHAHGEWPEHDLDHKDTIRSHNWLSNLRPATRTQNNANSSRRKNNTSGFKGVALTPEGTWRAQIGYQGKQKYLGRFPTPEAAHQAYAAAAESLFGEFARAG